MLCKNFINSFGESTVSWMFSSSSKKFAMVVRYTDTAEPGCTPHISIFLCTRHLPEKQLMYGNNWVSPKKVLHTRRCKSALWPCRQYSIGLPYLSTMRIGNALRVP